MRILFIYFSLVFVVAAEINISAPTFNPIDRTLPNFTNPLDHGVREQVTDNSNDIDGDTNAEVNNNTTNTGGSGVTGITNVNTGIVDSDNDVPTLISIRETMADLSRQQRGTRKTLSIDENGTLITNEESDTLVTLSDLHQELQKLNLSESDSLTDDITSETESKASSAESEITQIFDNVVENIPTLELPQPTGDFENYYVDIPEALIQYAGTSTINILNPAETFPQFPIPSLSTIASFVSLVIGLFAVYVYSHAMLKLAEHTMDAWVTANESNAVTNYSLFGNSVGAIGVKAIKASITLGAILASLTALAAVIVESVGIHGFSGSPTSVFDDIKNALIASAPFVEFALFWFFKLAPFISMIGMFGQYWGSVFLLKGITLISNRTARIAS